MNYVTDDTMNAYLRTVQPLFDGVLGEIASKQVLHNNSFLMLLASCVFFRSPPLFFLL